MLVCVEHHWDVPEGDTIYRAAAQLRAALVDKVLVSFELRRDPRGRRAPEPGVTITAVDSAGKHLLIHFSDGQVLHTHMQMTGAWHVYKTGQRWRRPGHTARVVLRVDDGTSAVCFAAPIVELRRESEPRERVTSASRMLDRIGPDLCSAEVDLDAFVRDPVVENLPRCPACGSLLRQHVLWFDECYDSHADYQWDRVCAAAADAELFIFVGTSFSVGVTELLVESALSRGKPVFSIDPHAPAPIPGVIAVRAPSETLLPEVLRDLGVSGRAF